MESNNMAEVPGAHTSDIDSTEGAPAEGTTLHHGIGEEEEEHREDSKKTEAMTPEHKQKLQSNRVKIVESLHNIEGVLDHLLGRSCIKREDAQDILSKPTESAKTRAMLDLLPYRSDGTFYALLQALVETQETPHLYQVLKDDTMQDMPLCRSGPPTTGPAKHFHEQLMQFHKNKLKKLSTHSDCGMHDLSTHISLTLYERRSSAVEMRHGFRELSMTKTSGVPIQPENLFAKLQDESDPRSVLMLGGPGVGKTATCFFFLQEYTEQRLWNGDINFVIFIVLRELNHIMNEMSFQDLLFNCYGPSPRNENECEHVWRYLEANQRSIVIILDGLDEASGLGINVDKRLQIPFQSTFKSAPVPTLLHNLIEGNILPEAHLLISARPHLARALKHKVDRLVELEGLDFLKFSELTMKMFDDRIQLAMSITKYIEDHPNIANLCSSPVNAKGLLNHIKECHDECAQEFAEDSLPSSRSGLMFYLILNLLRNHHKELKQQTSLSSKDITQCCRSIIVKLANVAYHGLFTEKNVKQLFGEEDLKTCGLDIQDVLASGLMAGHPSSVRDGFWRVERIFMQFPHLTFQEQLGALQLTQMPAEDIECIINEQNGERDMILALCLGGMTDSICQELLQILYPDTPVELYMDKAQRMLKAIWAAPRSLQDDGPLFSITVLHESGLYSLANDLSKRLANVYQTLNLWHTRLTSADCTSIVKLLQHVQEPFYELVLAGAIDAQMLHRIFEAHSFKGLSLSTTFTKEMIKELGQQLSGDYPIYQLSLVIHNAMFEWKEFKVLHNDSLKCVYVNRGFNTSNMQALCDTLASLQSLQALFLGRGVLPPLRISHLSGLRYLTLWDCGLVGEDIKAVAEIVVSSQLLWLDITDNTIGTQGAVNLAQCLQDPHNALEGLLLTMCRINRQGVQCLCRALYHNRSLKVLQLTGNDIGEDVSPIVTILKDSMIEELYVSRCGISSEGGCQIMNGITDNTRLTVLDVGGRTLRNASFARSVQDALRCNSHLHALRLHGCDLTDDILNQITSGLKYNSTLQLLDISDNPSLTSSSISSVLTDAQLQHLCVNGCELDLEGWREVGKAVRRSPKLVSCIVGEWSLKDTLDGFVDEMVASPYTGPLQHLFLFADRKSKVAVQVQRLMQNASYSISVSDDNWSVRVLSGLVWQCVPPEIRNWMSTNYLLTF